MKELEILVDDLKKHLNAKELMLRSNPKFNSYTEGELLNRQRDISSFEFACKNCETNPFHRNEIISNFTKDAERIKKEIDRITC